jgi:uncharacterized membrane protein
MSDAVPVFADPSPRVRLVAVDRPWAWLAAGWRDLCRAPGVSLVYGLAVALASVALALALFFAGYVWMLLPLTGGFFLLAPLIAVGLYEASRRLERGEDPTLAGALAAVRRNPAQIANIGVMLLVIHLVWIRVAMLLFALFFEGRNPGLGTLLPQLFSEAGLPLLLVGGAIGFAFAAITFAVSAVSIPMLLDRDVNAFVAVATSAVAVQRNWKPMALWAALIVVFVGVGIAMLFVGLVVVLPLIGHATWHAYRDLVEPG